jgi:hypothetical protein
VKPARNMRTVSPCLNSIDAVKVMLRDDTFLAAGGLKPRVEPNIKEPTDWTESSRLPTTSPFLASDPSEIKSTFGFIPCEGKIKFLIVH